MLFKNIPFSASTKLSLPLSCWVCSGALATPTNWPHLILMSDCFLWNGVCLNRLKCTVLHKLKNHCTLTQSWWCSGMDSMNREQKIIGLNLSDATCVCMINAIGLNLSDATCDFMINAKANECICVIWVQNRSLKLKVLLKHYLQIIYNFRSQNVNKTSQEHFNGTIEKHSQNLPATKNVRYHNIQGTKCASWDETECLELEKYSNF